MKIFLPIVALALLSFVVFNRTTESSYKSRTIATRDTEIPIPTQVYDHMQDEEGFGERKRQYFEMIHGNNPDVDWRAINNANFRAIYEQRVVKRKNKTPEIFANGEIEAEWIERGSNNNAGNVRISDYDPSTDAVYSISDGGTLWKGSISGTTWEPLNEDIQFGAHALKVFYTGAGDLRIIAAIGHDLYYSDDEGDTWTQSTGFVSSPDYGGAINLVRLNDPQNTLLYLYEGYDFGLDEWENRLAFSVNDGVTFTHVTDFSISNKDFISMSVPYNSATAYILNENDDTYKFEGGVLIPISTGLSLNGTNQSHIVANMTATDTTIYVLMDHEELYKSTDNAISFLPVSTLPVATWDVGIQVSIDNPDVLYFGEMELYRSFDGGVNWSLVNFWWQYYDDVATKIHADIMSISPFKDSNGDEFTLVPNHGGISISYDNLLTTENIGMVNLNVGQFYDVITSPINSNYIFGGTQDQGFQRTIEGNLLTSSYFEQVISGDYGHMQFSNNGQGIWIQYPGADFAYYENAMTDPNSAFWHNIDGSDMPNYDWIVPTSAAPNPADDYILVGGGEESGGSGSYLIKLENAGGAANVSQYNFDFNAASGGNISAIETTPLDENKWYVATDNGKFYHSEDAGATWTVASSFTGPGSDWIYSSDIYASRLTQGLVYVGGSGYTTEPVFMSVNGGVSFVEISTGLPETMVHELCMDPAEKYLFAATDAGPYVYVVSEGEWFELLGLSAPVQEYISVEFVEAEHLVRFSTWGRGIWDFKLTQVAETPEIISENNNSIYPNPSASGNVTIQSDKNSAFIIYNLQGQEVLRSLLINGTNTFNLSHLKNGMYVFIMIDQKGTITKEKWVRN